MHLQGMSDHRHNVGRSNRIHEEGATRFTASTTLTTRRSDCKYHSKEGAATMGRYDRGWGSEKEGSIHRERAAKSMRRSKQDYEESATNITRKERANTRKKRIAATTAGRSEPHHKYRQERARARGRSDYQQKEGATINDMHREGATVSTSARRRDRDYHCEAGASTVTERANAVEGIGRNDYKLFCTRRHDSTSGPGQ